MKGGNSTFGLEWQRLQARRFCALLKIEKGFVWKQLEYEMEA
jgi:hypothetical protein